MNNYNDPEIAPAEPLVIPKPEENPKTYPEESPWVFPQPKINPTPKG